MIRKKKARYGEGDWFAVPLQSGGYGVGIVARKSTLLLCYFFGPPRESPPGSTAELDRLHHTQAVYRAHVGILGLEDGKWPIVGHHANWSRDRFPMPVFGWIDETFRIGYRVIYSEQAPASCRREPCSIEEAMLLPDDSLPGHVAVERCLGEILAGRRRYLGDPRPGTLPWTDRFPPPPDRNNPYNRPRKPATPTTLPLSDDARVIEATPESSDPSKPHVVDHYLYFKTRADALSAKKELSKQKLTCDPVRKGADDVSWLVLAHQIIVPTIEAIEAEGERMTALAEKYGGEYDGWEAETVPLSKT